MLTRALSRAGIRRCGFCSAAAADAAEGTVLAHRRTAWDQGKYAARRLRKEGKVPCVLQGGGHRDQNPFIPISVDFKELMKLGRKPNFERKLMTLLLDGEPIQV